MEGFQERITEILTIFKFCSIDLLSFKHGTGIFFARSGSWLFIRLHEISGKFRIAGLEKQIRFWIRSLLFIMPSSMGKKLLLITWEIWQIISDVSILSRCPWISKNSHIPISVQRTYSGASNILNERIKHITEIAMTFNFIIILDLNYLSDLINIKFKGCNKSIFGDLNLI